MIVVGALVLVPLVTLVILKWREKQRLKAQRRAAELHRGMQVPKSLRATRAKIGSE